MSCFVTVEFAHISFRFISENGITIFQGTTKVEHHFIVSTYHLLHRHYRIIYQKVKKNLYEKRNQNHLPAPSCQTGKHFFIRVICGSFVLVYHINWRVPIPSVKNEWGWYVVWPAFGCRREINHKYQTPTQCGTFMLFSLARDMRTDMCFWTLFWYKLFNIWKNDPIYLYKNDR